MKLFAISPEGTVEIPQGTDYEVSVCADAHLELRWDGIVENRRLSLECNGKRGKLDLRHGESARIGSASKLFGLLAVQELCEDTGERNNYYWRMKIGDQIAAKPMSAPKPVPATEPDAKPAPKVDPADDVSEAVKQAEKILIELSQKKANLEAEIATCSTSLDDLRTTVKRLKKERDELEADNQRLAKLQGGIRNLKAEVKAADMEYRDKVRLKDEKMEASARMDGELDNLDRQMEQCTMDLRARQAAVEALKAQTEDEEETIREALKPYFGQTATQQTQQRLETASDELRDQAARVETLIKGNAALKARAEWLEQASKTLEQLSGSRLEALKKQLKTIFNALDRCVDMDAEIERNVHLALEALNDDMYKARLKKVEDSRSAIEELVEQSRKIRDTVFDVVSEQIEK